MHYKFYTNGLHAYITNNLKEKCRYYSYDCLIILLKLFGGFGRGKIIVSLVELMKYQIMLVSFFELS